MEEDEKTEYQVTMNGEIKAFENVEKATEYILKRKKELYYCSIRKVVGTGCVNFSITRI